MGNRYTKTTLSVFQRVRVTKYTNGKTIYLPSLRWVVLIQVKVAEKFVENISCRIPLIAFPA